MFTLIRTSFLFFILALTASAASEENISQQVDATPGGKLVVDVEFGTIDGIAGADNKVAVEAHRNIDFGDDAREKEYFAATPVTITRDGNVITVRAHNSNQNWWNFGHSGMHVQYTIYVPKKFETDLHTEGGDVAAAEVTGNANVKTSGGKLAFRHLEGTLSANTGGGSIEVANCLGPIKIETSGGDITVADGTGTLDARTSGGRIEVRNFTGDTEVRTSGGNLSLERNTGKILG